MSMNQHYHSSDTTPWWTSSSSAHQQHQQYQPMLNIQQTHNPTPSPAWPSQPYHTNQNSFNSSNYHDPHATSNSDHRYHAESPAFNLDIEEHGEGDIDEITPNHTTRRDEYDPERNRDAAHERESMFEKQLTPSDVGKLNRLVIPKQHAEKYFPLSGESTQQKSLLLSFEDESGKCWKFRYSYWNSSQSYVLTKGWSRYVKEKRLDAGDIVLFERDASDGQRLFIGWRRRRQQIDQSAGAHVSRAVSGHNNTGMMDARRRGGNDGVDVVCTTRGVYSARHPYPAHLPYQSECLHAGTQVSSQTTSVASSPKVLRLFGVNMECQSDGSEPSTPNASSTSSHALKLHHHHT